MKNIAVLGGGSWGTAIARMLSIKGHSVYFYIMEKDRAEEVLMTGENKNFLPGVKVPNSIKITTSIKEAVANSEVVVLAIPTNACRIVLNEIKNFAADKIIVNLAKGIEQNSLERISQVCKEVLPENSFAVLSGPSHAEEVGRDIPTAVSVASEDLNISKYVQDIFSTQYFRVYTNPDLIGVEFGGALKNIIALAAGISDGLGYGDNTKAALMTRGIYEMSKLGIELGAKSQTFSGLSGIGDLIVTCTSMHSRNRRAGILIGQGKSVEEAIEEVGMVVEGMKTTKSAYELAQKYNVEMPITSKLFDVLYNRGNARKAVNDLMNRDKKEEIEDIFFY